jgi:hypothetical protein
MPKLISRSLSSAGFYLNLWFVIMDSYFSTIAEAAATLTGLIFVGLSLNLQRILAVRHLPARALGSLMLMTNILIVSSFCLIKGQPLLWLGIEVLACGLLIWIVSLRMDIKMYREVVQLYRFHYFRNLVFTQLAVLPYLAGGLLLVCGSGDGLYWLIPGMTISIIKALTDSWVLLVEINR